MMLMKLKTLYWNSWDWKWTILKIFYSKAFAL